ncbi:hypothetical protein CVT24_008246 [Panaeolus cyanescens]|uniref:GH16 domain-containing protein n=1 Tax=Panaeolus cyanescens TaxID=181874 RepID=A0A409VF78_9AGAR|nr:hypothetical protein CVT24_008246 [Panaeolus cyanescens]
MTFAQRPSHSDFATGYGDDMEATSRLVPPNSARSSIQFSLSPSPHQWGMPLDMTSVDPDDYLHNPEPGSRKNNDNGTVFTMRGLGNLGCLFILVAGMITLFAGKPLSIMQVYPIIMNVTEKKQTTQGGFNLGGINATGQIPDFTGNYGLIDRDTPASAYTKRSWETGEEMVLVFSDEFNTDGRSFYPGDDPFWEAVDLHYWGTNDLEWYDPTQPTTGNGSLLLTIEQVNPADNHNMDYRSGMIQSWNKFCFTGGLLEASVMLPGSNSVSGFWPAVWAMGNLGRAGFGGSLDGMWPFTYDTCDVGTLPNQTYPGTQTPAAALSGGDPSREGVLSYLPGQKLSACTCPGESHPGPMRSDGSYVGRAAPEIDVIEALVDSEGGKVSLSAQWAPYNAGYNWLNTSSNMIIHDPEHTVLNAYKGGVYQQTTSGLAVTNQECYELHGRCFAEYGFEYRPGFDEGYITWINDGRRSWTLYGPGMGPDPLSEIGARPVPMEPMYIIANLGFSSNFGHLDLENLIFPATMSIDYIRVYQPKSAVNIGCDPKNFPTAKYIETYKHIYTNPNLTTWEQTGEPWPKNRRMPGGCD